MKVLMISKALVVGAYHGKLRELSKCGVDLTVVVPRAWAAQKLENIQPEGYKLVVADCRFSGAHHFHYYPRIRSLVERGTWDLIHVDEEPFNFVTHHSLLACRRAGTKTIFFTWQNILKRYPPPFNLFEKRVFDAVSGAIAGNAEAREVLRRRGFSKPIAVVPQFGVDPAVLCKRDASELRSRLRLDGSFVVGFMGRIVREKGIDTLIKAFALLPQDSTLVLVGSGPYLHRLGAMIDQLGISRRVRSAPWVDSRDVPEFMNAFDVLVLPSLTSRNWKEQFGRVLIEAMACGTCVVGSDSGEIPSVIGDAGLIFHEGDEYQLAERLRNLMEDPALRDALRVRGRARVMENFTHAKVAKETVAFYRRVCSSR